MGVEEVTVSPLAKESTRSQSLRRLIGVASLLCSLHFLISIYWWGEYVYYYAKGDAFEIDWGMLLHAVPAVILVCAFLLSYAFSRRNLKRAALLFILSLLVSVCLFLVDTGNNFYQLWTPVLRVGSEYSGFCKGNRYHYHTWWWYRKTELYRDMSTGTDYKFGYMNTDGNIAIELTFDRASPFSEGLAAVWKDKDGKYGFIDKSGRFVIQPKFDYTNRFQEGLAMVRFDGKHGFVDKSGSFVAQPQFDSASSFSEGLACVGIAGKYGYVDTNGLLVIAPQFNNAQSFHNGLAAVRIEDKWGFINKTGTFLIGPKFTRARDFSDGLAPVKSSLKWGYIDNRGDYLIEPQFDWATSFSEGLAAVGMGHERGYINTDGVMIIEPQLLILANKFSDGFAVVIKHNGKWGYRASTFYNHIDKSGKLLSDQWLDYAFSFSEGRAFVLRDRTTYCIDKTGKVIFEPKFNSASGFSEGLACVGLKVEQVTTPRPK